MTPGQERLWIVARLVPESPVYNIPVVFRRAGYLDPATFDRAWADLHERQEVLRAHFDEMDGRPVMVIPPHREPQTDLVDLRDQSDPERGLAQTLASLSMQPFDLRTGPVARLALIRAGESDWVVSVVLHHIIADGLSTVLLLQELEALYLARSSGRLPKVPELKIQYADHASALAETIARYGFRRELAYWRSVLDGASPSIELPSRRAQRSMQFRGALETVSIGREETARLSSLALEREATLYMALLAVFAGVLSHHTGEDDLVVGSPVSTRTNRELEPLIGLFLNLLPIRIDLRADPSFEELLGRVRLRVLDAFDHMEMPMELLQSASDGGRSGSPGAQVTFGLQSFLEREGRLAPIGESSGSHHGNGTAKFELSVAVAASDGGLAVSFEFDTDVLAPATVARIASDFARSIAACAADPNLALSNFPVTRTPIVFGSETTTPFRPIADVLRTVAAGHPDVVAIESPTASWTFLEFNRRVDALAARIRERRLRPDDRVAALISRSPAWAVAFFATLRAGAVFVPIDPTYPVVRISAMLSGCHAALIVAPNDADAAAIGDAAPVLGIDGDFGYDNPDPVVVERVAGDPAYEIFTSGTTGEPKAVTLTHGAIANFVHAQGDEIGAGIGDRILPVAAVGFDASIFELIMGACSGATLVMEAGRYAAGGDTLAETLERQAITHLTVTPSVLATVPARVLPALRTFIVAGEPCPARLITLWGPGRRILNAYGPAECTIWTTVHECQPSAERPPLGHPIRNVDIRVVDRYGRRSVVGVPGELWIGGAGVGLGYRSQVPGPPAFVPDPDAIEPGSSVYRTGDIARLQEDGTVDYLGRRDDQVKVRGCRVELGEVERAILKSPAVVATAVFAEQNNDETTLVACLVASGAPIDLVEIRRALALELPAHAVPGRLVTVDRLPTTAHGKLDRGALATQAQPTSIGAQVWWATPTETWLAGVWAEVLNASIDGPDSDFFDLGGNSLQVARVHTRVGEAIGGNLPLASYFESTRLRDLAARIAALGLSGRLPSEEPQNEPTPR